MIVWHVDMPLVLRGLSLRPVLRVYWACVCLSVSVCMRTMSGRVILAEPSGNVSVSSPFVFFSLLHAHTHADSHMARHVNVTSFFNRSFYTHTHTLKNRCGWVQLSLPDESFFVFTSFNFLFYSYSQLKIHYFISFTLFYLPYYNF